jgi:hypothetical protein
MFTRLRSVSAIAAFLVASSAAVSSPAAASCLPVEQLLPDPATPDAVVFVGTVAGSAADRTNLLVEAWYLGPGALGDIVVVGGRQPGVSTSADWTPAPGEQYVVVATRNPEGIFTTATCEQALGTPELLATLHDRYGDPMLPPFVVPPNPSGSPSASAATSPGASTGTPSPSPNAEVTSAGRFRS